MEGFDHLLDWTLKRGSHPFPGPDGGTCINEAALVAAGFSYQPVEAVEQMPECFSRPLCNLAMLLNDTANDEERQRLLPYVTRLACADTPEIERERARYISVHMQCLYVTGIWFGAVPIPFSKGLEVLDAALAIGRQADPLGPEQAVTRMEGMKTMAAVAKPDPDKPFFSKVKSWLAMKETDHAA